MQVGKPSKDDLATGWREFSASTGTWEFLPTSTRPHNTAELTHLRVLTWNVDFSASATAERLCALITKVLSLSPQVDVLLLQELCDYVPSPSLAALLEISGIRQDYIISDASAQPWYGLYGTATLVRKQLRDQLGTVHRIKQPTFPTNYLRDALVSELFAGPSRLLKLVNVHLDSLPQGNAYRPRQLKVCANVLQSEPSGGGLVAGDFNPITPADDRLAETLGMTDAWRAVKGDGNEAEGYTWGIQAKEQFPAKRMDRVVFFGGLRPTNIEVIKCGEVEVPNTGERMFWSDHCGVLVDFAL